MRPVIHVGTDTKSRTPSADPAQSNPPRKGEPTRLIPSVLLNAPKPPGISPGLMMNRPSLRVIFRVANRKKD